MVIKSEDAEKEVSQRILVCTASKDEGQNLRESITDIYNKKIAKLNDNNIDLSKIPATHDNSEFEAEIIMSSEDGKTISSRTLSTILKIMGDAIIFKTSGSSGVLYSDLVDPKTLKINMSWKSILLHTPQSKLKNGINPLKCFSVNDINGKMNLCLKHPKRGFYDKASLYQAMYNKAQFISMSVKKNENRESYSNSITP
jgi:hypothetical protein